MARASDMKFSVDVRRFVEKTNLSLDAALRSIALEVLRRVVLRSPVDTGRLRGGWVVGLGSMPTGGGGRDPHGRGARTIERGWGQIARAKMGQNIYIVNNIPYVLTIEYGQYPNPPKRGTYVKSGRIRGGVVGPGHVILSAGGFSKQAPQGMVRISVREVVREIDAIIRGAQQAGGGA